MIIFYEEKDKSICLVKFTKEVSNRLITELINKVIPKGCRYKAVNDDEIPTEDMDCWEWDEEIVPDGVSEVSSIFTNETLQEIIDDKNKQAEAISKS